MEERKSRNTNKHKKKWSDHPGLSSKEGRETDRLIGIRDYSETSRHKQGETVTVETL